MFRFTQEPSSVSQSQCLANITDMVRRCLSIRTWSVLWRHIRAVMKGRGGGLLRVLKRIKTKILTTFVLTSTVEPYTYL